MMGEKEDIREANEKYDKLYKLTREQDSLQLSIPAVSESIAISRSIGDRANAIILETSKWKGDLEPIIKHQYLLEKVTSLINDYNALAHDYAIIFDEPVVMITYSTKEERIDVPEKIRKENLKMIFRSIRYNPKTEKLEKVV